MPKVFSSFWLRCSSALLLSAIVTLTSLSAWSRPKSQVNSSTATTSVANQPRPRVTYRVRKQSVNRYQPKPRVTYAVRKNSVNRDRPKSRVTYAVRRKSTTRYIPKRSVSSVKPQNSLANKALKQKIAEKILSLQQTNQRWIQIDLSSQRLIAWEGTNPVYAVVVSTGKRSTPTPIGTFAVKTKYESTRMVGPGYDVSNVPHTMYYHGGYAIHGAYWHNKFGTPVSHGCTNVAPDHAEWLFDWATVGTPIVVHY
ncbi:MAG TPA: L,D-transpeptidase [Leptolyngbyaceae cyanobacterium]